jgi:pre-mRNA-splicing factor ATP-dependent RNA helicase DHX15/PRP43
MSGNAPQDNPYLAHRHPTQRGAGPSGSNLTAVGVKEPLYGFLPRKVTADQVRTALVRGHRIG